MAAIYRKSKKPRDDFWTEWCSRPPAAVLVWLLQRSPVTPNQVTFLSLAVFGAAAAALVFWRSWFGLAAGAATVQLSYILDCVDGQLARYKGLASPVGALLDFLMDELKAFLLTGAVAVRVWSDTGDVAWLLVGIGGLFVVASGIALTTFMRRKEYLEATGAAPRDLEGSGGGRRSPLALAIAAVEWIGRSVIQYPRHFWIFCLLDRLDLFLLAYLGAHLLYLGRSGLVILVKLGRPARRAAAETRGSIPEGSTRS